MKQNCIQIERELLKFKPRRKRALINALGSTIKFVTGNLDQNDLDNINTNLNILFMNQEKAIKQVEGYTSFANHITERYTNDINIIQQNINTSLQGLNKLNSKFNNELIIQYNIHQSQNLLEILHSIQRTIALSFNEIVNLEIMSNTELNEITNHLKLIYRKDELFDLDVAHPFKIIEFSKFKVISVNNVITCILYIPILNPSSYTYQRLYPFPNQRNEILLPPAMFRLFGAEGELWTDEKCDKIEKQTLCTSTPNKSNCSLNNIHKCNFAKATNSFKIIVQLNNNQILMACKTPTEVIEECKDKVTSNPVSNNVLLSSRENCKLIINNKHYINTYSNFTYNIQSLNVDNLRVTKHVQFEQKHLDNLQELREEAKELNYDVKLHPILQITHASVTSILLIIVIFIFMIMYVFRHKLLTFLRENRKISKEEELEMEIPLQNQKKLYPSLPTAPRDERRGRLELRGEELCTQTLGVLEQKPF